VDTVHAQGTRDLIDVLIVAAVRLYQQGLARALSDDRRCRVVVAAGTANRPEPQTTQSLEALMSFCRGRAPQVLL
jgi:hypothetical protein